MIVGLTGGIACGKSTVTEILRGLGAYVVDADVWARKVVEPGSEGLREIVQAFGETVLNTEAALDRKALGQIVFADENKRHMLNAITHPRVRAGMKAETTQFLESNPGTPIVWDVPLLFEGETKNYVDATIVVYVDVETQKQRLMKRDQITMDHAMKRIEAQMPIETKRQLADYVIDNTGSLDNTREQVQQTWEILQVRAQQQTQNES